MPTIQLSQDKQAIVSDEDFEFLMQWKWSAGGRYVARSTKRGEIEGKRRIVLMHRAIMERMLGGPIPEGMEVDHINRDRYDNRRANLRVVTRKQNAMNRSPNKVSSGKASRFKGLSWFCNKWVVRIKIGGETVYLGRYTMEEEAARIYDKAAREAFGEFATLNFPDD